MVGMNKKVAVYRKEHFNAAHRLFNPAWDEATNTKVFGKCALPNYHGHNYELEIKVTGEMNPETGIVMDLKKLKEIIQIHVENRYDHTNLNLDLIEFQNKIPTAENICIEIYNILRLQISEDLDLVVRLYETPRNYVEYPV